MGGSVAHPRAHRRCGDDRDRRSRNRDLTALEDERGARRRVTVLASEGSLEPGVFGWFAPRLLWPRGIGAYLDDSQIEAILAHELAHVSRYDNLIAALQMAVQAVFWFHPLVWWIGARLVDERERACDEDVLRHGSEPQVYAESILRTCRFSIESPLACVAGVTGADLKRRIQTIMMHSRCGHAECLEAGLARDRRYRRGWRTGGNWSRARTSSPRAGR
jgi:beta-lactamase regulating signal transducer with metallopeptidase domain